MEASVRGKLIEKFDPVEKCERMENVIWKYRTTTDA